MRREGWRCPCELRRLSSLSRTPRRQCGALQTVTQYNVDCQRGKQISFRGFFSLLVSLARRLLSHYSCQTVVVEGHLMSKSLNVRLEHFRPLPPPVNVRLCRFVCLPKCQLTKQLQRVFISTRIYVRSVGGFFLVHFHFFSICLAFCVLIVFIFYFSFFPLFCFLFVLFFHVFFVLFCCLFHSSHLSFQFSFPLSPWSSGAVQTVTQFAAFVSCGAGRPTRTLSPDGNPAVFFILRTKPLFYLFFLFFFVRPVCFTVPVRLSDENYLVIDVLTFWHGPEF